LATVGPVRAAGAAEAETTVWRLDANWGYPIGPKAKTRCVCNACHKHAANKIFATEAAAAAGRIHICCLCQPVPFTIPAAVGTEFFDDGTVSVDRRWAAVTALLVAADVGATDASPPSLPVTGVSISESMGIGAGALGLGALFLAFRNRQDPERGLTSGS
jgi:LPXTG-motif cell wall-anchored protein